MDTKLVAGGVVAILVIAGAIGAVAMMNQKGGGDTGDTSNPGVLHDTWYLRYVETATFVDDQDKPLTDVNDCEIESRYVDPKSKEMDLKLTDIRKEIFQGTLGTEKISGRYNEFRIWFDVVSESDPDHYSTNTGIYDGNRMALSTFVYNDEGVLCSVTYSLYVYDVNSNVSPLIDRVDYNMPYEHVYSKYHSELDFAPGGDPYGMDSGIHHEYARSHSLISLFKVLDEDDNPIGVQAIVSLGTTPTGDAIGTIATYDFIDGEVYNLRGDVVMNAGKMTIFQYMIGTINECQYVESEYNVPYTKGFGDLPGVLSGKYSGTVTSYYSDGHTSKNNISKYFTQVSRTIYAVEDAGAEKYHWFGTMTMGPFFTVEVKIGYDGGSIIAGILEGTVDSMGNIKLTGIIHDMDTLSEVVVIYDLKPVE